MANNQYINKVEYGGDTLMDLTSDTVTSDVLVTGYTAHDRSGASISGSLSTFVPSGSTAAAGLVPAPSTTAGTTAFLCEDGTWKVPVDTTYSVFTGATTSVAGTAGLVPAPATTDTYKVLSGDGTWKDRIIILSYGSTTWADALAAYQCSAIVYCRASSNANPATGSQTRMAFLAYVNDATNPTELEFQYYRSVSTHKSTQMGDEVYVYKLNKTNGWSVTKRLASIQSITGAGITVGYTANTNVITLTNDVTVSDSLTDTSTTKALSAAQGKALSDQIALLVPSKTFTIPASDSKLITFEANSRAILFGNNNVNGYFMCFAFCDGSGTTGNIPVMTGSNVTITNNSNYTLSFVNGTARDIKCGILVMDGGVTV